MTTFVTGGTSSIGRVLVREMSKRGMPARLLVRAGSHLEGLALPGVTFAEGDVTDLEAVRRGMQGCRFVTHMAAVVGQNLPEAEWWRVNRDGARNVLQAALDQRVDSMVQVSSISVLGFTQPGETADESRPIEAAKYRSLYQKTKHAADEAARANAARGLPVKVVYPGFGFGCSHAASHPSLHEMTLLRMAAGKPVAVLGGGRSRLCLAYYDDTVEGILLAHERGQAGEGYLLINENLTFTELWAIIAAILGKRPPSSHVPLGVMKTASSLARFITGKSFIPPDLFEMLDHDWCFDNRKAREELGWNPMPVAQAMRETWQAYQELGWKNRA